jgi:hypothetical protein
LTAKGVLTRNGLQAGDRAPDVRLGSGQWLSDHLRGPEWKLLHFGSIDLAPMPFLKLIPANEEALHHAYGLSEGLVLILPDGYLVLLATTADEVRKYFAQWR